MTPAVSVLMPVYNAERYVAAAVESVLGQTFADFECLLLDDGSTDGSLAVLRRYAAADPRVRVVSRPNTGLVGALNELLALARGELVARMDADDVCRPGRFAAQVAFLRDHPDHLAVGCSADLIDPDGERIGRWDMPTGHADIDAACLRGQMRMIHSALTGRRAAVLEVGGYRADRDGSEDLDLVLRLAERGKLANLPDALLEVRRHSESVVHTQPARVRAAAVRALADAWARRGLGVPPEPPAVSAAGRASAAHDHRTWAWMALAVGNRPAARKHARRALRLSPLAAASWKTAYCALRGH